MDKENWGDLIEFSSFIDPPLDVEDNDDYLNLGLDAFNEGLETAEAFLAITIEEDGTPRMVWAGDLNTYLVVGALDVAKTLFKDRIRS